MNVAKELRKLILQHFGYFDFEVSTVFNLYDTLMTLDEMADFIVDMEATFNLELDESKLPFDNFKSLVQYIEMQLN